MTPLRAKGPSIFRVVLGGGLVDQGPSWGSKFEACRVAGQGCSRQQGQQAHRLVVRINGEVGRKGAKLIMQDWGTVNSDPGEATLLPAHLKRQDMRAS